LATKILEGIFEHDDFAVNTIIKQEGMTLRCNREQKNGKGLFQCLWRLEKNISQIAIRIIKLTLQMPHLEEK
jgi:hypothetical protein